LIARRVIVVIVLTAIQFDDQTRLPALEVDDVAANRRLPAEVKPKLAKSPKPHPERDFLARHRLSQLPGAFVRHSTPPGRSAATLP
jgi:hypothetical protein